MYFMECEIVLNDSLLLFRELEPQHHSVVIIGQ